MPRHLPDVVAAMLAVIPEDQSVLRVRLGCLARDCDFTAPEAM